MSGSLESMTGKVDYSFPEYDNPPADPIVLGQKWVQEAIDQKIREPRAMVLLTANNFKAMSSRVMAVNTLDYLKTSVFPNVTIASSYGSTMILSETRSRADQDYNGAPIFDSYAPYVLLEVVEPQSRIPVSYYERGQVVMNHLSKFALFPNILERDTAVRLPALGQNGGVAVSDIKTIAEVSGQAVIEGVH